MTMSCKNKVTSIGVKYDDRHAETPKYRVPYTMTLVLGYFADINEVNDCKGLAQLSEKRLECIHKLMRRFKERISRKKKTFLQDYFCSLLLSWK